MSKQSNIKNKIKDQYGNMALADGSLSCCSSSAACCGSSETVASPLESSKAVGYDSDNLS